MSVTALLLAAALAQVEPPPASASPGPSSPPPAAAAPTAAPVFRPVFWGFIDAQVSRTDPHGTAASTSTFEIRRARLGARGDVVKDVGFAVLWDGADASLKDAYVAAKQLPGLELRFGQWKTPFGYEQQESDTRLLWVNTSYVVQNLARGTDSRDLGAGAVGRWKLPAGLAAEVAASFVNGAGPNRRDDLDEKNVWGRAGLSGKAGRFTVRAGVSGGYGHQVASLGKDGRFGVQGDGATATLDDEYFYFHTVGADVSIDSPWLFAVAELATSRRAYTAFASPAAGTITDATFERTARGWYAGAYGKTPWNVGPILRVESYDPNRGPIADGLARWTFGAYGDLLPVNARLVFNYERDTSRPRASGRPGDRAILFGQVIF